MCSSDLDKQIGDKVIRIVYKKSSVGTNFYTAYISKFQKQLIMMTGLGRISKAIEEYSRTRKATGIKRIRDIIEIKADEVSNEILNLV